MSGEWETLTPKTSNGGWESAPTAPQPPSLTDRASNFVKMLPYYLSPTGLSQGMVEATSLQNDATSHIANKTGGAVAELAGRTPLPAEVAGGLGVAANVGVQAVPMLLGGAAGKLLGPSIQEKGVNLMQSALKPSKAELLSGDGRDAAKLLLDKGINVTPGGVERLRSEIDALNTEIKQRIASSTATVDKAGIAKRLDDLTDKFKMQVTPQSDLATISKAAQDFADNPLIKTINAIPVQLAQQMKQGTYRMLGEKAYGELKGSEIEAQKALARGIKEEVAKAVPNISDLNAAESKLINARDITEARVLMDANKNPFGLGLLAKNPGAWLAFAADRSPLMKSLLARALYSGNETIPGTLGALIGGGAGAVSGQPERK